MTTVTKKASEVPSLGYAMGHMMVERAKDGSIEHFYSLAFIPPWKPRTWMRYRRNFLNHISNLPEGKIWVETPDHPVPSRRIRRRFYA